MSADYTIILFGQLAQTMLFIPNMDIVKSPSIGDNKSIDKQVREIFGFYSFRGYVVGQIPQT